MRVVVPVRMVLVSLGFQVVWRAAQSISLGRIHEDVLAGLFVDVANDWKPQFKPPSMLRNMLDLVQ